jgi:hypothetical protein
VVGDVIVVSVVDSREVDAALAAQTLVRELNRQGVNAAPATGAVPVDAKSGTAMTIGSLVLSGSLSAVVVRQITQVVLALIQRKAAGEITFRRGDDELTITNASRDTERALVEWLNAQSGQSSGAGT